VESRIDILRGEGALLSLVRKCAETRKTYSPATVLKEAGGKKSSRKRIVVCSQDIHGGRV